MILSENCIKTLSKLFIGDEFDLYAYKSGPMIIKFFNRYFYYNDKYDFPNNKLSRWQIAYNKIVDMYNNGKIDSFISKIISLEYIKIELPQLSHQQLVGKRNEMIETLNEIFNVEGIRVINNSNGTKLVAINDDEISLGKGGFAECFLIKSKNIVVKRLLDEHCTSESIISRFKREYKITKSLSDLPGVINVYDYDEKEISYTMEYCESDLYNYVINNILDDSIRDKLINQIINTMKQVHERGIIHRDLSPNNIFIVNGIVKIADFGLGKNINEIYSHQTAKTNSFGTYGYCDITQLMKLKDGNKQSDIYSIGRLINFIYTKDPLNMSHKYWAAVQKATVPNTSIRYSSLVELEKGLKIIDKKEKDENSLKKYEEHLNNNLSLTEEDFQILHTFNGRDMYLMMKNSKFKKSFIMAKTIGGFLDDELINKLDILFDYIKSNKTNWEDYDYLGYLAIEIVLNESCSFPLKEKGIELINLSMKMRRYNIINAVKSVVLNNIEPYLEDQIEKEYLDA